MNKTQKWENLYGVGPVLDILKREVPIPDTRLTRMLEDLGEERELLGCEVDEILLKYLFHASPLVREGALQGLQFCLENPKVRQFLGDFVRSEKDSDLVKVAEQLLEFYCEKKMAAGQMNQERKDNRRIPMTDMKETK